MSNNWFDEYQDFEDLNYDDFTDYFSEEEGFEEAPSTVSNKVNDIFEWNPFENSDLNLEDLADTQIDIDDNENKPLIEDLVFGLGALSLYKKSKLKLSKQKQTKLKFDSLKKNSFWDKKDINLRKYRPKIDSQTLDIRDFWNISEKSEVRFDLFAKKKDISEIAVIRTKKKVKEVSVRTFDFVRKFSRFIIVTLSLILFIAIYKVSLENLVQSGYANLAELKSAETLSEARYSANNAKRDFLLSKILFFPLDITLNNPIVKVQSVEFASEIINTWKWITSWIDKAFYLENRISDLTKNKWIENINFTGLIASLEKDFDYIEDNILLANKSLDKAYKMVSDKKIIIPNWIDSQFKIWKTLLEKYSKKITKINKNREALYDILWKNRARNYLVVFQNSDEIRATGWFMWSMAEVKMFEWKVMDFKKTDIYKYEWDLKSANYRKERAPKWISELTRYLGLRDSNYYPNFRDSALKIDSFMDKINLNFDGVLFVNMNTVKPFLDEIWGVTLPSVWETFTSKNFSSLMSLLVESKKFKKGATGTPKEILFDFVDAFTKKVKEKGNYSKYASILLTELKNREIVFVPFDQKEYDLVGQIGLNWNMFFDEYFDYNYIVNTSISGNKSDRYIERTYDKIITKTWECTFDTVLKITQRHKFKIADEMAIKKYLLDHDVDSSAFNKMVKIQWKGDNVDYVRVLLPKTSKVGKWFTTKVENGNKVVDFYIKTKPWTTSTISLPYTVFSSNCEGYSYRFYKQSGIPNYNINYIWEGNSFELSKLNKDFIVEKKK